MNSATSESRDGRMDRWMDGGMNGWMDGGGVRSRVCILFWGVFEEVSKGIIKERRVRNVIKATFDITVCLALLPEAKFVGIKAVWQCLKTPSL